jgi:translocon-associated protein subunit alpha
MFKAWAFIGILLLSCLAVISRAEDEVVVENEEDLKQGMPNLNTEEVPQPTAGEEGPLSLASPDADVLLYFTHPANTKDIPTNQPIRMMIHFRNKGQQAISVDWLDASLRYPMDYSYIITNFTSVRYSHEVLPKQESSFAYGFFLSDAFHSRPFTLSINLHYHDVSGKFFTSAVFNETINVYEVEEGFDSQTFFLYVIFAALVVLGAVLIQQYVSQKQRKRPVKKAAAPTVESGTTKVSDVDYDWLPESTLRQISKSPKKSPTQNRSPQQSPKAKKRD